MTTSASTPVIAGLCFLPQNKQLTSTDPIHIGANHIGKVHGPLGSLSQQPTAYNSEDPFFAPHQVFDFESNGDDGYGSEEKMKRRIMRCQVKW